jgi:hypothetical protein
MAQEEGKPEPSPTLPSAPKQNRRFVAWLVVPFVIVILAYFVLSRHFAESDKNQIEEKRALQAKVQQLVADDERFAVCQTTGIDVVHMIERSINIERSLSGRASYDNEDYYFSDMSVPIATLSSNGYVRIKVNAGTQATWTLTPRGRALIGNLISSEYASQPTLSVKVLSGDDNQSNVASCSSPEVQHRTADNYGFNCEEDMRWTLLLSCRNLDGIDATTQMADGVKLDFSWNWKPTELGVAFGQRDSRERGEAYLLRVRNGLKVDRLFFKQE